MAKHSKNLPHSSSIQSCEYDDETNEMHITFSSGGKYRFEKVSKEIYDGLAAAESPGSYFHRFIRRKYNSNSVD